MSFQFRNARENDLPAIVAIYNSTVPGRMVTADTEEVSVASRMAWFRSHHPETRPLWVAEKNGEIAGWLSFHSFYGRPAYSITCEIAIYIHNQYRRQKLGDAFLKMAIEQAPALGIENLLGFIFAHNEPSLNLFYRHGFETWGKLPAVGKMDERYVDLLILGKSIKPL